MRRPGKVLVLGDDVRSFLATIRSLGRQGLEVHTAWATQGSPALRSRYVRKNHAVPVGEPDDNRWLHEFERLLLEEQFDLVIPCDDQRILPLQLERARLLRLARIELLDPKIQRIASSKHESSALASRLGLRVARSISVRSEVELDDAIRELSAPYVIRPVSSYSEDNFQRRNEVRKAFSLEKARAIGRELLSVSPLQIQENFIGRGTGVEFLAAQGEILVVFQHLRIHEPLHGGGSSYRTSIDLHPRMLADAEAIVHELRYDGVGMLEFKWDQRTDCYIFIEINARFWGSLPLAIACGADFPAFLYDYRVNGRREFPRRFRTGVYARNWVQDIDWLRTNASANRSDPSLSTLPWGEVAREFRHIFLGRERVDTLTLDDPLPFAAELGSWILAKSKVLRRKVFRWSKERTLVRAACSSRLKERLRTAKHIEFVCYGNICRSPFAAAALHTLLTSIRSSATTGSSGFYDRVGRVCPQEAIATSLERGVDLTKHRSRRLDRDTANRSDVILVFDWSNFEQLEAEFPEAAGKTFLLGMLERARPAAIADPWGEPMNVFRQTYERIERIIRNFLVPSLHPAKRRDT